MANEWIIQMQADGGYTIFDGDGEIAGKYSNPSTAAAHHVFALQELRRAKAALKLCRHVLEKGIEVRIGTNWPALRVPLEEAKLAADEVLNPPMQRIDLTANQRG